MYSPLPAGHIANAFVYYTSSFGGRDYVSCDNNTGHILPGRTLCYTSDVIDNEFTWDFLGVGREYAPNGTGGWTLVATGATAQIH